MKKPILFLTPFVSLFGANHFFEGLEAYNDERYQTAYHYFQNSVEIYNDKDAAFYIGEMYQNGYYFNKDINKANEWYKKSASLANKEAIIKNFSPIEKSNKYLEKEFDVLEDKETNKTLRESLFSAFSLRPHHVNYLMPISYKLGESYPSYTPTDVYKNVEAEMQISFKLNIFEDLFGFDEIYSLAYTQQSWWQIYTPSSPFREVNYNPEFFITFPIKWRHNNYLNFKWFRIALAHKSNGQGNVEEISPELLKNKTETNPLYLTNRSRSHNYLEASMSIQYKNIFAELHLWAPFLGSADLTDNPDLYKYLGYAQLNATYIKNDNYLTFKGRYNPITGKGSAEFQHSYKMSKDRNLYFFTKIFHGYGESMIDYNNRTTKVGFGVSFSPPTLF